MEASVQSKIEKHHNCYLRLCTGELLPEGHEDEYRPPSEREYPLTPDCRRCAQDNPDYFKGCVAKVFPVHAECHEDIHELEAYFVKKKRKGLLRWFKRSS